MPVDGSLYLSPGLMPDVTKSVLSHATGDDHPRPGTAALHATLSLADHLVGSLPALSTPDPAGPRNCGHASSGARPYTWVPTAIARTLTRIMGRMHRKYHIRRAWFE